jgi:alpha-amylase/alpha-mannosidase (GH57 family)
MKRWAQLLHFYQPPTQTHEILHRIAVESYRPVIEVLRKHENARAAVNIQGVLTELLLDHALGDVVDGLKELAERGRVEFVGSGKFHPILPLIPVPLQLESIRENAKTNGAAFGTAWAPAGFFPPEMCFSREVAVAVRETGHQWISLSGVACPAEWPTKQVYRTSKANGALAVLFRDDVRSNRISFRETDAASFIADVRGVGGADDSYVLTAMDAETFGHHIKGWENEFLGRTFELLAEQDDKDRLELVFPSELVASFPAGPIVEPLASSWSTSTDDLKANNPYPLWLSPDNELHHRQWRYVEQCIELTNTAERIAAAQESKDFAARARQVLQPALHSCQFWWASRRPWWDVSMIHRGLLLLNQVQLYSMRSIAAAEAGGADAADAELRNAYANELRRQIETDLIRDGLG